jgi:hypothetical protein
MRGATSIAEFFTGKAHACVLGLLEGEVRILLPIDGRMLLVIELRFGDGKITAIDAVADLDSVASLELEQFGWKRYDPDGARMLALTAGQRHGTRDPDQSLLPHSSS